MLIEKKLELKRNKTGEWKKILNGEEPLKTYGTIRIYPSIRDYIWNRLPTNFKGEDVTALFKEFYEEKLDRKLKDSSYRTYAGSYLRYFREMVDKESGKEITDSKQARKDLLKKSKDAYEHVDEHALESNKPSVSDETKKLLETEQRTAEHHLYQIAVETGWTGFRKGTPLIMITRRMANFSKDEITNAIDTLVKRKKAKRLPNNFIAFSE